VAATEVLEELGLTIGVAAVRTGLAQVVWPARLEVLGRRPLALLDCAHNVASAHALARALQASFPLVPPARRLLVFAGSRDKDLAGMLQALAPLFDRIVLTSFQGSSRAAPPKELMLVLPADKRDVSTAVENAVDAWRLARREASEHDLICVTGSVFLAGELRPVMAGELVV
jgi:dihydrofolate synthase / folylpolyglutamate synthase